MRVKVISVFKNKYTDELYPLGKELEVSKERYNEIKDYVEIISKTDKAEKNYATKDK